MGIGETILMRMFGRPEGALGRLGGAIMARMNRSIAAWAIDLLDVRPSHRALEAGFGPGVGIQLLAGAALSGQVVGIDPSEEMVAQATVRNQKGIESGRVDLRRGSAGRLPLEDNTFDRVLAVNSMQLWPDAGLGLREVRRVMKTGGKVALGFTHHSGQPKSGLIESLSAAGFADARVRETKGGFCALAAKA
jgi:ubiquinone/menaquinone biosynthesis C-methylase UbiE